MIFPILLVTGFIVLVIMINRDLNKQLKYYEQQEREHRETISQASPIAEKGDQMDQKRSSGKSKRSGSKRKKDTQQDSSQS